MAEKATERDIQSQVTIRLSRTRWRSVLRYVTCDKTDIRQQRPTPDVFHSELPPACEISRAWLSEFHCKDISRVAMSEQQPLLSSSQDQDVEQGSGSERDLEGEKGHIARWRDRTAEVLESRPWHYTVITLVCIIIYLVFVSSAHCTQSSNHDVCTISRSSLTQLASSQTLLTRYCPTLVSPPRDPTHLSG